MRRPRKRFKSDIIVAMVAVAQVAGLIGRSEDPAPTVVKGHRAIVGRVFSPPDCVGAGLETRPIWITNPADTVTNATSIGGGRSRRSTPYWP